MVDFYNLFWELDSESRCETLIASTPLHPVLGEIREIESVRIHNVSISPVASVYMAENRQ